MNSGMGLSLSNSITLREEPQYRGSYVAFDYEKCETHFLDQNEYLLLEVLSHNVATREDFIRFLETEGIYESTEAEEVIDRFSKAGIVENTRRLSSKTASPITHQEQKPHVPDSKIPILSFPTRVDITLTRRCNMNCVHCNMSAGKSIDGELEPEDWKSVLDQLEQQRVLKVHVSGGEPMSYPGFAEVLEHLGEKKYHASILTNATLLNDEIIKSLSRHRISVCISLDGATPEVHDAFRGKRGAFDKTMTGFEKLQAESVLCTVSTTLHRRNAHQLQKIVAICQRHNVYMLQFGFVDKIGRGVTATEWEIPYEEIVRVYDRFHGIESDYVGDMKLSIENPNDMMRASGRERDEITCKAGIYSMAIDADGTVFPCTMATQLRAIEIGNVKQDSLLQLWERDNWNFFRGDIELGDLTACSTCSDNRRCTMKRCRMRSLLNGDILGRPYKCPMQETQAIESVKQNYTSNQVF